MRLLLLQALACTAVFGLLYGACGMAVGFAIPILADRRSDTADVLLGKLGLGSLGIGLALLCIAVMLAGKPSLPSLRDTLLRWPRVAVVMLLPTAFCFGPTGGFLHIIGFGPAPYFYMLWDGDSPPSGGFEIIEGYEVRFFGYRLAILALGWTLVFWLASTWSRAQRSHE